MREIALQKLTLQEYMDMVFTAPTAPDRMRMTFRTTTTHKVQGQYALFPSVDLIASSLCSHLVMLDSESVFDDEELLQDIIDHTKIHRYSLHSSTFYLEGTKVYGYCGTIVLSVRGPDAMKRLAWMLFGFAPYSGVGIKTALGMGACEFEIINKE